MFRQNIGLTPQELQVLRPVLSNTRYAGVQADAERSLRFEILAERATISPRDPNSGVSQGGGSRGEGTWSASANEWTNVSCVTGSSSTKL
jgi:hypothetical protein